MAKAVARQETLSGAVFLKRNSTLPYKKIDDKPLREFERYMNAFYVSAPAGDDRQKVAIVFFSYCAVPCSPVWIFFLQVIKDGKAKWKTEGKKMDSETLAAWIADQEKKSVFVKAKASAASFFQPLPKDSPLEKKAKFQPPKELKLDAAAKSVERQPLAADGSSSAMFDPDRLAMDALLMDIEVVPTQLLQPDVLANSSFMKVLKDAARAQTKWVAKLLAYENGKQRKTTPTKLNQQIAELAVCLKQCKDPLASAAKLKVAANAAAKGKTVSDKIGFLSTATTAIIAFRTKLSEVNNAASPYFSQVNVSSGTLRCCPGLSVVQGLLP